jgi:hypothetical protein
MHQAPTLHRYETKLSPSKKLSFTEQAQVLHRKCDRILTSIQVQKENLGDAINENDGWKQEFISKKLDALYQEYHQAFFALIQPIVDRIEE